MRMLVRPGFARLALFDVMAPGGRVGTAGAAQKPGPVTDANAMVVTLDAGPIVSRPMLGRRGPAGAPRLARLTCRGADGQARDAIRFESPLEIFALPGPACWSVATTAPISWQRVSKVGISGAKRATCRPAGLAFNAAVPRTFGISTNPQKIRSR